MKRGCDLTSRLTSRGSGSRGSTSLGLGNQGRGSIWHGSQTHLGNETLPDSYSLDTDTFPLARVELADDHDEHRDLFHPMKGR